jgi:hypothetical protein
MGAAMMSAVKVFLIAPAVNPTEEAHKMFRVMDVSYTSAKPPEIHQERVGCAA